MFRPQQKYIEKEHHILGDLPFVNKKIGYSKRHVKKKLKKLRKPTDKRVKFRTNQTKKQQRVALQKLAPEDI